MPRSGLRLRGQLRDQNILLEVRAGTGGEEAALFASDLFRMYARYAERRRWKIEIVSHRGNDAHTGNDDFSAHGVWQTAIEASDCG